MSIREYSKSKEIRPRIAAMRENGATHDEIAVAVGLTRSTVTYHLSKTPVAVKSPLDVSSPYVRKGTNRASRARTGPTKKQIAAAERAAVVLRSALDAATERALIERTPESRRAVLDLMGKKR